MQTTDDTRYCGMGTWASADTLNGVGPCSDAGPRLSKSSMHVLCDAEVASLGVRVAMETACHCPAGAGVTAKRPRPAQKRSHWCGQQVSWAVPHPVGQRREAGSFLGRPGLERGTKPLLGDGTLRLLVGFAGMPLDLATDETYSVRPPCALRSDLRRGWTARATLPVASAFSFGCVSPRSPCVSCISVVFASQWTWYFLRAVGHRFIAKCPHLETTQVPVSRWMDDRWTWRREWELMLIHAVRRAGIRNVRGTERSQGQKSTARTTPWVWKHRRHGPQNPGPRRRCPQTTAVTLVTKQRVSAVLWAVRRPYLRVV